MEITIKGERNEIVEMLQAITSSKEQTEFVIDSGRVAQVLSNPSTMDINGEKENRNQKKKLGAIKQVGESLYVDGIQVKNILGGSISSEKTLDRVLVTCTIVGDTFEIIPKRS
ncbi:hypothetical protein [Enterococcus sp. AZ109]|uniref:hypothetical protein n=1 Tax=Enterococcus sp. AZ109 TaxID=2774634 RepID=UPI003F213C2C